MNKKCETWSVADGHCPNDATVRLVQTAANVDARACDEHAARWTRTKRVRGVVVRVHPMITVEPLR